MLFLTGAFFAAMCTGALADVSTCSDGDETSLLQVRGELRPASPLMEGKDCAIPSGMRAVRLGNSGLQMVVLGDNDIVSQSIARSGFWEVSSVAAMLRLAGLDAFPKTGTMLDVGANLGYYTLLFAHEGYNVIAVEPMTRNRAAMEASLCLNPQLRHLVRVVPAALVSPEEKAAHTECVIRSTNYEINIGNGWLKCSGSEPCLASDANCESVPVRTLDSVLAELAPSAVDVVKMDVEGHECNVFAGGASLFDTYSPTVLQVETTLPGSAECVRNKSDRYGYDLKHAGDNTEMVERTHQWRSRSTWTRGPAGLVGTE